MNTLFKRTLFIAYIATINLGSSIGIPANADVVTDWNNAALDAIRAGNTSPPIASRSLAILHPSIYDAVNGITRSHEQYLVQAQCRVVHRVQPPRAPQRIRRSLIYSQLKHPASMRFMPRFWQQSLMAHKKMLASHGVNLWRTRSSPREQTMVPMPLSRRPEAAVLVCGYRLPPRFFHICYRNGALSSRLE